MTIGLIMITQYLYINLINLIESIYMTKTLITSSTAENIKESSTAHVERLN